MAKQSTITSAQAEAEKLAARKAKQKARVEEAGKLCRCGCGEVVARTYKPGHDARLRSMLLRRFDAGEVAAAEQLTEEFGYLPEVLNERMAKNIAKAEKAEKAAAKPAKEAADA